jgi:cytoskeletal protein CcmA (bactofilin family)
MSIFKTNVQAEKPNVQPEGNLSTIAQGVVITGDLICEGIVRVEGIIKGSVTCKARLVVGAKGKIEGSVDARNATVEGEIHGGLIVRELLQIMATGKIFGEVVTEKLTMEAGGIFTGKCKMGAEARDILAKAPIKSPNDHPMRNLKTEMLETREHDTDKPKEKEKEKDAKPGN